MTMLWRHKARGTTYEIIGEARAQCETPIQDDEFLVLYRDVEHGTYSVRRKTEFEDGRFEVVPTRQAQTS